MFVESNKVWDSSRDDLGRIMVVEEDGDGGLCVRVCMCGPWSDTYYNETLGLTEGEDEFYVFPYLLGSRRRFSFSILPRPSLPL